MNLDPETFFRALDWHFRLHGMQMNWQETDPNCRHLEADASFADGQAAWTKQSFRVSPLLDIWQLVYSHAADDTVLNATNRSTLIGLDPYFNLTDAWVNGTLRVELTSRQAAQIVRLADVVAVKTSRQIQLGV